MADSPWDDRVKSFLKKTSGELKRLGSDVKEEAQKLMNEVQDPERQKQLREGLKEVGTWARKTAEEVATVVEDGVKKAEVALGKASQSVSERVGDLVTPVAPAKPPAVDDSATPQATPPSPPPQMDDAAAPAPKPKRKPRKTIGRATDDGEE
jgi:gas vesicle protein